MTDKDTINEPWINITDTELATKVKTLYPGHQAYKEICESASNRILLLSEEVQRLTDRETAAKAILDKCTNGYDTYVWLENHEEVNCATINKIRNDISILNILTSHFIKINDGLPLTPMKIAGELSKMISDRKETINKRPINV